MTYRYHPPTVDSLDITPSDDGLAVRVGIFNTTDNGTYAAIEVMNRDIEEVITALRIASKAPHVFTRDDETPNDVPAEYTYEVDSTAGTWTGTATSRAHATRLARAANPNMSITAVRVLR